MAKKKKTYKEIHGTTRVGDFLRSTVGGDGLGKVLGAGFSLATGDVKGAIGKLFDNGKLDEAQREFALKLLESDLKENEEISKRWQYDMTSDSWLSKNIRPLTLGYLVFMTTLIAILDSAMEGFKVDEAWVTLLKSILLIVIAAYFGGRSYEKSKKL